jgi:hypothetical protein
MILKKHPQKQASGAALLSETELIMGNKKREPVEVAYIDQLLKTRDIVLAVNDGWEAMRLANDFPYGPHFKGKDYDSAMAEVKILQRRFSLIEPNLQALSANLNELYPAGAAFVEKHPEFMELNERIRPPQTVSFNLGNIEAQTALSSLQGAIENTLTRLEVNFSRGN